MKRFLVALLLLVFWAVLLCGGTGCGFMEKLPDIEACVMIGGKKVCAVKSGGSWYIRADLSPDERAEALSILERSH